jgi:hypothetical protein
VVRYTRWLLRRSAYLMCLTFNLFFLSCIASTEDYTSGLFTYWVLNTIAWSLCGMCMTIELEDAHRYRFRYLLPHTNKLIIHTYIHI